jgi:cytochrome c oxidase cbb3-type subunit I/II
VPYTESEIAGAQESIVSQAAGIVARLEQAGISAEADREIIAMIAYLQRLGKDGRAAIAAGQTAGVPAGTPGASP